MKRFVLCVTLLFFGIIKHKAQDLSHLPVGPSLISASSVHNPGAAEEITETLLIKLLTFEGRLDNNKIRLQWTIDENQAADRFEVEKSIDGRNFAIAALVFTSEKAGNENYAFFETMTDTDKIFYRLKMIDKAQKVEYSKMLVIPAGNNPLTINQGSNYYAFGVIKR